ncbi:MAG: hypothetical protein K1W09_06600 [Akkermansia muciniphila]
MRAWQIFALPTLFFPRSKQEFFSFSTFTASGQSGKVQAKTSIDKLASVQTQELTSRRLRNFKSETGRED